MRKLRPLYFDRQGQPISEDEWLRRLGSPGVKVEHTMVREARISTVWLGLDHSHGDGLPLIFETMVFGLEGEGAPRWRYSTEVEAIDGHWSAVQWVQDTLRIPHGSREDRMIPDDDRPVADAEPGSVDIAGLDKAELLAALHNATRPLGLGTITALRRDMTHEEAAAIIQDRLGGGDLGGRRGPFDFDYVAGRPVKCDIGGPRISAFHVARYDRDAGAGTMARVVGELRAAYEQRMAERAARLSPTT